MKKINTIEELLTQIESLVERTDCEEMGQNENPNKSAAVVLSADSTGKCRIMCCGNVYNQAKLIAHVIKQNPLLQVLVLHCISE